MALRTRDKVRNKIRSVRQDFKEKFVINLKTVADVTVTLDQIIVASEQVKSGIAQAKLEFDVTPKGANTAGRQGGDDSPSLCDVWKQTRELETGPAVSSCDAALDHLNKQSTVMSRIQGQMEFMQVPTPAPPPLAAVVATLVATAVGHAQQHSTVFFVVVCVRAALVVRLAGGWPVTSVGVISHVRCLVRHGRTSPFTFGQKTRDKYEDMIEEQVGLNKEKRIECVNLNMKITNLETEQMSLDAKCKELHIQNQTLSAEWEKKKLDTDSKKVKALKNTVFQFQSELEETEAQVNESKAKLKKTETLLVKAKTKANQLNIELGELKILLEAMHSIKTHKSTPGKIQPDV